MEIVNPLGFKFKRKIIEILIFRWLNIQFMTNKNNLDKIDTETIKILEMFQLLDLPMISILKEFKNTQSFKKIKIMKRYKKYRFNRYYLLRKEAVLYEENLICFLYIFLKFFKFDLESNK